MPTSGSNFQIVFSLITAVAIVILLVVMDGQTSYTQRVSEFLSALPPEGATCRVEGQVQQLAPNAFKLCESITCVNIDTTLLKTGPTLRPNQTVVVFGQWTRSAIQADDIITPCQVH